MKPVRPLVLGALLLVCCESAQGVPRDPKPAPAPSAPEPAPLPPAPPPQQLARASDCQAVDAEAQPLSTQGDLPAGSLLILGPGGTCKLLYSAGALLRLVGPARVQASPRGEAALLLREGTLELDLSQGALTATSGFWFALPSARVELVQGARLVARAFAGGASELYVVSGNAKVQTAASARPWLLSAGHGLSFSVAGEGTEIAKKLDRLEAARAWMLDRPGTKAPPEGLAAQLERFTRALEAAEAEAARGKALLARHHALAQGAPEAMALQRELAVQQAEALRQQRLVLGQADSLAVWLLDPAFAQKGELEPLLARAALIRP